MSLLNYLPVQVDKLAKNKDVYIEVLEELQELLNYTKKQVQESYYFTELEEFTQQIVSNYFEKT